MTNLTEERLAEIRGYLESFEKFGTRSMRDQAECSFPLAQEVPFLLEIIDSQKTDLQKCKDALTRIEYYEKECYDYEPLDAKAAYEMVKIAKEALESLSLSL